MRCFLDFCETSVRGDYLDYRVLADGFQMDRELIQCQRDVLLSELIEVRLLLGDVKAQIAAWDTRERSTNLAGF